MGGLIVPVTVRTDTGMPLTIEGPSGAADGDSPLWSAAQGKAVWGPAGGGGGGVPTAARRLSCTTFNQTSVTTGNGSGNPYTTYRPNLWVIGGATVLQPGTWPNPAPSVVADVAGPFTAWDIVDEGWYTLRYSIIAAFADDASTPAWVRHQASTYWQNRPHIAVQTMTKGNLTAAFPGPGMPGSTWDVELSPFYAPANEAGSFNLNIDFQWPGITSTPSNWSIMADVARVG